MSCPPLRAVRKTLQLDFFGKSNVLLLKVLFESLIFIGKCARLVCEGSSGRRGRGRHIQDRDSNTWQVPGDSELLRYQRLREKYDY